LERCSSFSHLGANLSGVKADSLTICPNYIHWELQATTPRFKQDNSMTDFQSFRNAVLEDDDLQEQVISIINTATANGSGMGDGIATLAKTHGFTITSDEVYAHQDFLGQDGDLTDFELELISGGQLGGKGGSS
jgi:predicted ribosomally synthesized peptide with nif11-like leader|tara:strand:+ start:1135 stop:1536 length:402 start_codon:yes stop_codon:yes gene_type:complete